jgi:ABC-type nitrate/sulfonate/bicarbonate transport system permease component
MTEVQEAASVAAEPLPAAAPAPRRAPGRDRLSMVTFNLLALVVFLGIWAGSSAALRSTFFPGPMTVAETSASLLVEGDIQGYTLLYHAYVSLYRVFLGFAASCLTAIPLGIAFGLWRPLYLGTRLVSEPLRFIPPLAWIPLAILFFRGLGRYVFLIWVGAFFPLFILTMNAVSAASPTFVDVARVFGASRRFIALKVIVPNALPQIVGAMRAVMSPAWMCIVAAEMVAAELVGLGQLIFNYATLLRMDVVIVGMISIGVLGLLLNEAFMAVERAVFRYRQEVRL